MTYEFNRLHAWVSFELGFAQDPTPFLEADVAVWNLAKAHKVASILAPRIIRSDVSDRFKEEAQRYWHLAALREEYYGSRCDELVSLFGSHGLNVFPTKGVLVAREAYPRRGFRPFRDLDLLIPSKQLLQAHQLLLRQGFVQLFPHGPLKRAPSPKGDAELAAVAGIDAISYQQGDLFLELHTSIVPPMLGRYPIGDTFSAEDALIHLLIHATRHHFLFGLRHLTDIALWIKAKKPSMSGVVEKLNEARLMYLAYPAWRLAAHFFPQMVPLVEWRPSHLIRFYAERMIKQFPQAPEHAMMLSGSPLPFLLAKEGGIQGTVRTLRGDEALKAYQIGAGVSRWRSSAWHAWRPAGLLWRHAPVMKEWFKFAFRPSNRARL